MKHVIGLLVCAAITGCAIDKIPANTAEATRYRCENSVAFTVRFANDSAVVDSNGGYEVLYRTKDGQTASPAGNTAQYSNPRMRAEFGLGATGNEAVLRFLLQPVVVRCARD